MDQGNEDITNTNHTSDDNNNSDRNDNDNSNTTTTTDANETDRRDGQAGHDNSQVDPPSSISNSISVSNKSTTPLNKTTTPAGAPTSAHKNVTKTSVNNNNNSSKSNTTLSSANRATSNIISSVNKSSSSSNNNNNNNNDNDNNNNNSNNNASNKKRPSEDVDNTTGHIQKKIRNRKYKGCELTSIQNMVAGFQKNVHEGLLDLFKNHIFVGCVDKALVLVQYKTKLYLLNMVTLSKELVYQEVFHRFGDFDRIKLSSPLPIYNLFMIALESPLSGWQESSGEKDSIAKKLTDLMLERSEMLREYFAIDVDDEGNLRALPQVLDDYIPQLKYLPLFMLWLCTEVEWEYEVECFEGIARQIADFYCVQPESVYTDDPNFKPMTYQQPTTTSKPDDRPPPPPDSTDGHSAEWIVQHTVFPHLRKNFFPPKGFSNDGTIIQIAQLENLYKIFERC